jgi:hypothetical protein
MAVIEEKSIDVWNLDNVQACEEGMKLASEFMDACQRGVERVGIEQTLNLRGDFHFQYSRFAAHFEVCKKCSET